MKHRTYEISLESCNEVSGTSFKRSSLLQCCTPCVEEHVQLQSHDHGKDIIPIKNTDSHFCEEQIIAIVFGGLARSSFRLY